MNSVCVISGTALAERSQDPTYFHIYYNHRGANQGRERKEEKQKTNKKETSEFIELYTSTDEIHCLCIICLRSKVSFKKEQKPEFRWYGGLRICCCHCCGAGVIPGPGTFTSRGTETKWNSSFHCLQWRQYLAYSRCSRALLKRKKEKKSTRNKISRGEEWQPLHTPQELNYICHGYNQKKTK